MDLMIFTTAPWLNVQAIFDGIMIGAVFSLIAYGMALIWGVMKIINVCQGEYVILGGYITFYLYNTYGINPLYTVPVASLFVFLVSFAIYKLVIVKVIERDLFVSILATFGLSIIIQQLMNTIFGADVEVAQSGLGTEFLFDNMVTVPVTRVFSLIITILVAAIVVIFMHYSKLGRAIRATSQNKRAAKVLGVDTDKVYGYTYAINGAICGVAGSLVAMTFTLHPYIGLPYTIRSFMIVITAGLGNFAAIITSGMGLGILEQYADYIIGTQFRIGFVFLLLVFIIIWRSRKLLKKREYLK